MSGPHRQPWTPRALWILSAILGSSIALEASPPPQAKAKAEKDKKASTDAKKASDALSPEKLQLPKPGFAGRLRKVLVAEESSRGLKARLEMVPSAYRYQMALGMEELARAGYGKIELAQKLKALHAKHKKERGKALFFVTLESSGGSANHFVQGSLSKHVGMRGKTQKSISISGEDPKVKVEKWRVFEQQADQRAAFDKSLMRFTKLTFQYTSDFKEGDKDPLTVQLKEFVAVTDPLADKDNKSGARSHEGVNASLRQVSTPRWTDQVIPEIRLQLFPGKWNEPDPPRGFDEILEALEAGG